MSFGEVYNITTREEYEKLKTKGFDALFFNKNFTLDHRLRLEIQEELFGKGNHQTNNQKFYRYAWNRKAFHRCEECMKPLPKYSATFVSHILSRGAHPETAYDLRNFNILCKECHDRWENGDREEMRIYNRNNSIIKTLKKEYGKD